VQLQDSALSYHGASVGDEITMYIDFSYRDVSTEETTSSTAPQGGAPTSDASNFHRALATLATLSGSPMPTEVHQILGASGAKKDVIIVDKFKVAASYPKSVGKFPAAYGNVALIDCHYVFDYMFDYAKNDYA